MSFSIFDFLKFQNLKKGVTVKKILISLVAIVVLLVAGESSKNDLLLCELLYVNGKPLMQYEEKTQCYLNDISEINSHLSLSLIEIHKMGWTMVGKRIIEGETFIAYEKK